MDQKKSEYKIPKWLKNLQENSWELELLISGGAIFSLFQLSDFYIDWIQGLRITSNFRGAHWLLFVGMYGIKVLTLGFILHLLLRAYWLALVCINYVFPQGIRTEKIHWKKPFTFKEENQLDLKDQIIRVDRNCGLVMYMSIISAFAIFGSILLAVLTASALSLSESIWDIDAFGWIGDLLFYLILIYILDLIFFGLFRRIPLLSYITFPIFRIYDLVSFRFAYQKSLWLFSTNIKRSKFFIGATTFAIVALVSTYITTYRVLHWPNVLDERTYKWQRTNEQRDRQIFFDIAMDRIYMENWTEDFSRPWGLGKKIVDGNLLEVYVRYDKAVDVLIDAVDEEFKNRSFEEVMEVRINDEVVEAKWYTTSKSTKIHDIGIMAMLNLSHLPDGAYMLTITVKEKFRQIHEDLVNRPFFVSAPFWIDRISLNIPDSSLN